MNKLYEIPFYIMLIIFHLIYQKFSYNKLIVDFEIWTLSRSNKP